MDLVQPSTRQYLATLKNQEDDEKEDKKEDKKEDRSRREEWRG